MTTSYIPKSFMAIFAHPDDIEFSCAATLAKWVRAGSRGAYLLVTSGDVGIATEGMTREKAAEIREKESLEAAAVAGITDVTFFREPDGMVENNISLRRRVVREIRRFQPEVVVTGDPTVVYTEWGGVNHPDHRAVGGVALDAVYPACGQPNLFEDILEEDGYPAHKVRKIYVVSWAAGQTLIDVTDTIDVKIEALEKHVSQVGESEGLGDRIRQRSIDRARGVEFEYAERFKVLTIESDEKWAKLQAEKPKQYTR